MDSKRESSGAVLTGAGVTWLGMGVNLVLSAGKLLAGWLCYSHTIFADGLHSLSDCVTDVAVLAGLRVSSRPADEDHHYGHRRAMTLVTAALALVLLAAGGYVVYGSVLSVAEAGSPVRAAVPLALAIASIVLKEGLYRLTVRVGRRTGDSSVVANAWHHRSDAASSVAAAAGLTAVVIGGDKWHFLDHLTAVVLVSFLGVVAYRILRDAAGELMDRAPSEALTRQIGAAVSATPGVRSFHAFRARRLGGKVDMDVHVQVDPGLTVRAGHDIASEVRRRIMGCCPAVMSVVVHVEPAED